MEQIIIGLDPGSLHFGYSVLRCSTNSYEALDFGVIHILKEPNLSKRLDVIYSRLMPLFTTHKPDLVSVEEIFYHKNVKSAVILAHARAIALLLCSQHKGELKEYSPRKIKLAVTGKGNADKHAVKRMVCRLLSINEKSLTLDASDALAIGLCAYFDRFNSIPISPSKKSKNQSHSGKWSMELIQKNGWTIRE